VVVKNNTSYLTNSSYSHIFYVNDLLTGTLALDVATIGIIDSTYMCIGISDKQLAPGAGFSTGTVWIYRADGQKLNGANPAVTGTAYGATYTSGDVIGVAVDSTAGTIIFYKNGTSQGTAYTNVTGTVFPFVYQWLAGCNQSVNFGQQPFVYTPPTGYVGLNTYNL
jgi:hypothetical protein